MNIYRYKITYTIYYMIGNQENHFEFTDNLSRDDIGFTEMVKARIKAHIKGKDMPLANYEYVIEEL